MLSWFVSPKRLTMKVWPKLNKTLLNKLRSDFTCLSYCLDIEGHEVDFHSGTLFHALTKERGWGNLKKSYIESSLGLFCPSPVFHNPVPCKRDHKSCRCCLQGQSQGRCLKFFYKEWDKNKNISIRDDLSGRLDQDHTKSSKSCKDIIRVSTSVYRWYHFVTHCHRAPWSVCKLSLSPSLPGKWGEGGCSHTLPENWVVTSTLYFFTRIFANMHNFQFPTSITSWTQSRWHSVIE